MTIRRVTLFKCPAQDKIQELLEGFKTLSSTAVKDNQKYILTTTVRPTQPDQRSQGYTVAAISDFASLEDMQYYDTECEAHKVLKESAKDLGLQGPPLTVFFEV